MADTTMGTATRPALFLRNATGLVKAWSTFDAFVYSFWSINLITLGLYGMSFVYWVPDAQLLAAILIFGVLTTFLVITYAMLVSVMPRTGGDYAWQSRVLWRPRVRPVHHRVVVHPVPVGADLRQHPERPVLPSPRLHAPMVGR